MPKQHNLTKKYREYLWKSRLCFFDTWKKFLSLIFICQQVNIWRSCYVFFKNKYWNHWTLSLYTLVYFEPFSQSILWPCLLTSIKGHTHLVQGPCRWRMVHYSLRLVGLGNMFQRIFFAHIYTQLCSNTARLNTKMAYKVMCCFFCRHSFLIISFVLSFEIATHVVEFFLSPLLCWKALEDFVFSLLHFF